MGYFRDSAELRQILGGFFERMRTDPVLGPQVRTAAVEVTFFFAAPDLIVTIDAVNPPQQGGDFNISYGPTQLEPPLKLTMTADTAHRFWQGRLNVMVALAQKEVSIEGSVGKAMALLPAVQPAFAR